MLKSIGALVLVHSREVVRFSKCPLREVPLYTVPVALIRSNHWAASVTQWLEHRPSKQCVVGSNPTRAAFFFSEKKELFRLVVLPFLYL